MFEQEHGFGKLLFLSKLVRIDSLGAHEFTAGPEMVSGILPQVAKW
jgi:hypothetical protein